MTAGWNKGLKHSKEWRSKIQQAMIQYWRELTDESLRRKRTAAATRSKHMQQQEQREQ